MIMYEHNDLSNAISVLFLLLKSVTVGVHFTDQNIHTTTIHDKSSVCNSYMLYST